jgi:hypothetical protein
MNRDCNNCGVPEAWDKNRSSMSCIPCGAWAPYLGEEVQTPWVGRVHPRGYFLSGEPYPYTEAA